MKTSNRTIHDAASTRRTTRTRAALFLTTSCVSAMALSGPAHAQEAPVSLPPVEVTTTAPKPAKPKAASQAAAPTVSSPVVEQPVDAGPVEPTTRADAFPKASLGTGTTEIDGYVAGATSSATKTNTPIKDIPQSISIVTRQEAEDRGSESVGEALQYVPGVTVAQGEGQRDQITIRGQQTTADFFVDGVRDDIEYYRDMYNVDALEVLKGPTAMTFGRGGGGGVINRVTKKADGRRVREVTFNTGMYERARTTIDVGNAITPNAAFRLNAMYESSESFRDFFELERYGINPTLAFKPTDRTKVSLSYEYYKDDRFVDRGVPSFNGTPYRGRSEQFYGAPAFNRSEFEGHTATATIEHRTDLGLNFRNHTFYMTADKYYANTYPNSPANPAANTVSIDGYAMGTYRDSFINQTDVSYVWNMGNGIRHNLLAGTEISYQETDVLRDQTSFGAPGGPRPITVSLSDPIYNGPLFLDRPQRRWFTELTTYSAYIQDQLEITKYFELIGGLRFDRFDIDYTNATNPASVVNLERVDDVWSYRVGAVFKPTETASIYVATSTSFLPGAGDQFINLTTTPTGDTLEPEEFRNKEFGFKWEIAPRLFFTGAMYELDRANQIITTGPLAGEQAGLTRTQGGELSLTGYVTDKWQISAGWGHQIAKVVEGNSAGNQLPFVPNNVFSMWNRYQLMPMFAAAVGVIHQSESYASLDNTVELPDFTRVDAAFFLDFNENWSAQVNVENVFDEDYFASAHNNNNISPGAPRSAFVTIKAKF